MTKKTAVILFNLGGPDKLSSVQGFLFNLFYDPAIIRLINPFRWLLAKFISSRREKYAQEIYKQMGGASSILPITQKQAFALEKKLGKNFKVFVSMRYWHPFAKEIIEDIKSYKPDEILLLPLYPQFSTTTTKSSLDEFSELLKQEGLHAKAVCCYFKNQNFIKSHASLIKEKLPKGNYRILFSAHGLPEYIVKQGDPYQWQVEQGVVEIVKHLGGNTDYVICYQSKVGRMKWLTPSTEDELMKAAKENIAVVIVPIALVSDHSETLVELDIEYKKLFEENCQKPYIRIEALNENEYFVESLKDQVHLMLEGNKSINRDNVEIFTERKCDSSFGKCMCKNN
jgi:ferrochelatase